MIILGEDALLQKFGIFDIGMTIVVANFLVTNSFSQLSPYFPPDIELDTVMRSLTENFRYILITDDSTLRIQSAVPLHKQITTIETTPLDDIADELTRRPTVTTSISGCILNTSGNYLNTKTRLFT